jgi:hypothetical protein
MPHLPWNGVRNSANRFSRDHQNDRSESAEKQTFWNDFFHVFGLRRACRICRSQLQREQPGSRMSR